MTPSTADETATGPRGRPPSTTREEVARVAFELFARDGFDGTTVDDIAAAIGIGRRTLFRYYASKNDIVWGDFDWVCERLRAALRAAPPGATLMEALTAAVVESNSYDGDAEDELRIRMGLITTVPALQAHSMLRYAAWRAVVAEYVAERTGGGADELVPQVVAHVALAASMAAFVRWVAEPGSDLARNLEQAFALIGSGLDV